MKDINNPSAPFALASQSTPTGQHLLTNLKESLSATVRGQIDVVTALSGWVECRELNVVPQRGAKGAYIFAGPTGVGKTLLAETLAKQLGDGNGFVRIDCSEFKTLQSYDRLFGDRQGDIGLIGQRYRQVPKGVWLFDEIEKAHPEFVQVFLQGVDAARITTAKGDVLDLRNIYFIITTNLGCAEIIGRKHLPFTSLEKHVVRSVERWMRPELRGRFSKPLVFRPLSRESQREITAMHLNTILKHNVAQGRTIGVDENVVEFLLQRGCSPRLGARDLARTIDEWVGPAINKAVRSGLRGDGTLRVQGDALILVAS